MESPNSVQSSPADNSFADTLLHQCGDDFVFLHQFWFELRDLTIFSVHRSPVVTSASEGCGAVLEELTLPMGEADG